MEFRLFSGLDYVALVETEWLPDFCQIDNTQEHTFIGKHSHSLQNNGSEKPCPILSFDSRLDHRCRQFNKLLHQCGVALVLLK